MIAHRAQLEPKKLASNQRGAARRTLHLDVQGSGDFGSSEVTILDLSPTGFLLEASDTLAVGEAIDLDWPGGGAVRAVVKWSSGRFFGCQFKQPISTAALSAALLRAAPAPLNSAQSHVPTLAPEDDDEDDLQPEGALSFNAKLRWILGFSLLLWAALAVLASLAWRFFS